MKLFITSMIFCVFCYSLLSQKTITGKVTDATDNDPLPGCNIFLINNILTGTVTGPDGYFSLQINNASFDDTLIFSFVGYKETKHPVHLLFDHDNVIKMDIKENIIHETVIKAKRLISEEFTLEKIDQLDIYLNPLSKADPLLAVNGLAASTTLDESANISLRGSSPAETGIFFNDVPIYNAVRFSQINGIGTFSIFNTEIVKDIYVFPGNPPLEYGGATSGLVSIQSENNVSNITSTGNISFGLAHIGGLATLRPTKTTAVTLFSNYQPSAFFIGLNGETFKDLEDFTTTDFGINILQDIGEKSKLKIFNYALKEGFEYKLRHPSYDGSFKQNKKRDFIVTNFTRQFKNGEISLNNGLSLSEENYLYGNTDITIDKYDCFISLNNLIFIKDFTFKSGISSDYRQGKIEGQLPVFNYAISPTHPTFDIDENENLQVTEIFGYGKQKLTERIILGAGIRKNIPNNNQKNYLSWQGNIHINPFEEHELTFSTGKYHKYELPQAGIDSIFFIESNQISLDYKIEKQNAELVSSLFYKSLLNDGQLKEVYGYEIYIKTDILKDIESQISYTFLDAKEKNGHMFIPSEYDFSYYLRGSIQYTGFYQTSISAIVLLREGKYYLPVDESNYVENLEVYEPIINQSLSYNRLKDYCKVDISASRVFSIRDKYSLIGYISVSNIFNRENIREINYNFDYSESFNEYFSKRSVYFGFVIMI